MSGIEYMRDELQKEFVRRKAESVINVFESQMGDLSDDEQAGVGLAVCLSVLSGFDRETRERLLDYIDEEYNMDEEEDEIEEDERYD